MDVVAEAGVPEAKIGEIAERAGVSRATFYELFENKQSCFVEAHRELSERLLERTDAAILEGAPARAIDAAFAAIVDFAGREPGQFAFLTHEAMLAGPDALDRRDELIAQISEQIERADDSAPDASELPDVPARILLGGLLRLLGIRMRSGRENPTALLAELSGWVDYFRVRGGVERRWRLDGDPLAPAHGQVRTTAMAPAPLPRGRHRLPPALVERVQRERVMHAAAKVIRAKGYAGASVTDIVAAAGVSREVFYSHFRSRADAYVATHQMIFEQFMAVTAGAFFASQGPWPEQVWQAGGALTELLAGTPDLAHFAFVESYALGAAIEQRTDNAMVAFTVFLREGHRYRPSAPALSPAAADATAVATIDMAAYDIRHRRLDELFGLRPVITYMVLTPFVGAEEARAFVDRKLQEGA